MGNIEQAKEDLQRVADNYTTSEAVELGLPNTQSVTLDPSKGDKGFSFMAKRAYRMANYTSKQALKAAMLLSIKFIDATGDSRLEVKKGDQLRIEKTGATFTRGGDVYTVTFEEVSLLEEQEASREEIHAQASAERLDIALDESPSGGIEEVEISAEPEEIAAASRPIAPNVIGWGPAPRTTLGAALTEVSHQHPGCGLTMEEQPGYRHFGLEVHRVNFMNTAGDIRNLVVIHQPKKDIFKITKSFADPRPEWINRDDFLDQIDSYLA